MAKVKEKRWGCHIIVAYTAIHLRPLFTECIPVGPDIYWAAWRYSLETPTHGPGLTMSRLIAA